MSPCTRSAHAWHRTATIALLGVLVACGAAEGALDGPIGEVPNGAKGVVSGRVTDARGRPIVGATVVVNNAVWFNKNIVLKSDASGIYRYDMPATDSWYVRGTTDVTYNGHTYTLELHPDYAGSFTGVDGHVVNLTWKMTGEVPKEFGHDGFYGGSVEMDAGLDLSDLAGVTLTLTPVGTLIDGSVGGAITRRVDAAIGTFALRDVPMGRYTVRATRNGAPLVIRMRHTTDWVPEVTTDFEPAYVGATSYGIYFQVATAG